MSFPSLPSARIDPLLTNVLQAHTVEEYIAGDILPDIAVDEETGIIPRLGNNHLRRYSSRRAVYDESEHRMEFKYEQSDQYQIGFYDLSAYVPDRLTRKGGAQKPFNPRRDASFVTKEAMLLERELALAALFTSTSVFTNNETLSGSSQFDNYGTSNPDQKIESARNAVHAAIGREANAISMNRRVANTLKSHPFFLDLMKRNAGQRVSNINLSQFASLLKEYFEFDYLYVGKAIYVNSNEGQTPETKTNVWGNDINVFHRAKNPGMFQPSLGYSFVPNIGRDFAKVRRHPNDKGDIVENIMAYQDNILDADSGFLIKDVI